MKTTDTATTRPARLIVGLILLVLISPGSASAETEVSYDLAFNSAYVWRGITFTDGAVFQPSITVSHSSGFSFNTWGNLDIDDVNGLDGEFQEVDLTASYGFGSDTVSAEIGFIEYLFPNGVGPGTREIYFSLGFDVVLSPTITLYYDIDEVEDYYGSFGVEWGNEVSNQWSYAVGLLAGFAGEDFAATAGGVDSGLFNGEVNFNLTYSAGNFSAGGFVAFTEPLDDDVLPDQPVDFYGGFFLGFSF